jgi:hypothetical protein
MLFCALYLLTLSYMAYVSRVTNDWRKVSFRGKTICFRWETMNQVKDRAQVAKRASPSRPRRKTKTQVNTLLIQVLSLVEAAKKEWESLAWVRSVPEPSVSRLAVTCDMKDCLQWQSLPIRRPDQTDWTKARRIFFIQEHESSKTAKD